MRGRCAGLWRPGENVSPVTLILAGLVVSLYCGAINQLLVLFHHDQLQRCLWSTGTLTRPTEYRSAPVAAAVWRRGADTAAAASAHADGLDDGVARNLGLALSLARLAALTGDCAQRYWLTPSASSALSACLRRCWQKCSAHAVCWRA